MKKFVFIDESIRTQYTIAAVIVPITKVAEYRKEMAQLRAKGARTFHMGKERKPRQDAAVRTLARMGYCELVSATSSSRVQALARQECLRTLVSYLPGDEYHLVLDRTNQDSRDRDTILRLRFESRRVLDFVHLERSHDPGLWGADIVAWFSGRPRPPKLEIKRLSSHA